MKRWVRTVLNFAEHCRDLTGAGVVVDVPCELQRKLQQFSVGMVKLCRKQPSFSQAQFMGTLLAQCLARQWIHVLRQLLGASERISYVKVVLVSRSRFCPALWRKWPCSSTTTAVVCAILALLVPIHLVLCSLRLSAGLGYGEVFIVGASVAVFARVGHHFHEPLVSGRHWFAVRAFPEKSFF